jgi:hypothetical protein
MARALVLATSYDPETRDTRRWASSLVEKLAGYGHTSKFLVGAEVTRENLAHNISSADCILFYGHGEQDKLCAQPTGYLWKKEFPTLVDARDTSYFGNHPVYAVACEALSVLGKHYGTASPPGSFVGYRMPFMVNPANTFPFQVIVNDSAVEFVAGKPAVDVVQILESKWERLYDWCINPNSPGAHTPDAWVTGLAALNDMHVIGSAP